MVIPAPVDPAAFPLLLWAAVAFSGFVLLLREVQVLFSLLRRVGRLRWWPLLAVIPLAGSLWSLALALGAAEAYSSIQWPSCLSLESRGCANFFRVWSLGYPQSLAERLATFN